MRALWFAAVISANLAFASGPADFDAGRYLNDVKFLASPEMRGRADGSPELETAAKYIARQFELAGLRPADGKSFLQAFPITTSARMGRHNRLQVRVHGNDTQDLPIDQEFRPFGFSSKGKIGGGVVFAGYGITAPEYNYDDYVGLDAVGKVVVVLRHEPQEFDEKSVFQGKIYTDHAQFYSKAANARRHGAAAVILVSDRVNHKNDPDELEKFGRIEGPADAGIPFVQVKEAVVEGWFRAAGKDLLRIETDIDKDLKPRSTPLTAVEVSGAVDVEREVKTVHNVVGYLPGETPEYIIVGAHYDHLGLGEQFSMAPSLAGTIHPGADDNASGTAGVIELARRLAAGPKPHRGTLFLSFAGEELGLLGSGYYANHPEMPLAQAVAMINLDMIGRVRDGKIYVGGVGTGSTLRRDLDELTPKYALHVDYSDTSGYGSSDHTSFTAKQIPVLFFFSGLHGDYHKPGDTWDKIDAGQAVVVLRLVADTVHQLTIDPQRPQFVRVQEKSNPRDGSAAGTGGGSGYGPYFGSIPDFAEPPKGVRFADVRDGSPAQQAGLKAGDILVKFGGRDIRNLYDFTYALREKKPGDEVQVEVLRAGRPIAAKVLLKERR